MAGSPPPSSTPHRCCRRASGPLWRIWQKGCINASTHRMKLFQWCHGARKRIHIFWLLTFSPTKPLILGGYSTVYIYIHHISCYQILSPDSANVFKTCPVRDGGEGIATHQDVEKVQRNGSLFSWPKILTKAGCPEILQDLMVKKWILDVSESFGQLNTQFNFSKEWISSIDRSRIIQLGDAV